jgi:hypothetical protein
MTPSLLTGKKSRKQQYFAINYVALHAGTAMPEGDWFSNLLTPCNPKSKQEVDTLSSSINRRTEMASSIKTQSATAASEALAHLSKLQTSDGTLLMWAVENLEMVIEEMSESDHPSDWKMGRLLDHALRDLIDATGHIDRAVMALGGQPAYTEV